MAAGTIVERRSVRMKAGRCFLVYLLTLATPLVAACPWPRSQPGPAQKAETILAVERMAQVYRELTLFRAQGGNMGLLPRISILLPCSQLLLKRHLSFLFFV